MNQIKIGKFISQLRHEKNLTQEELGQKIGVTNKTVSRWENGHYIPDIDILIVLSDIFNVSINELLNGERVQNNNDFKKIAEENIISIAKNEVFSFEEKYAFWKHKWLKEHIFLIVLCIIIVLVLFIIAFIKNIGWLRIVYFFSISLLYCFIRNKMMIYIEYNIYGDGKHK